MPGTKHLNPLLTMEKNKNVPKLRFPEFTGEWEEKKLGEITEKIIYGMNAAATSYDGQNKYLRITDIDESSRSFTPKPLTSPDGLIEDKYRLSEGDLVFARTGASVGKSYLYNKSDGNLYFAGFLIRFTILNENPYFIYAQTLKESFNKWVQLMSMRSGQPGINAEEYKTLPIFLPSFPEQTKIASFLTAVDEKLIQLKKKKTLLEQYKKGIMQKLFSQELRFKDDNNQDFPDWQEKTLGEISKITNGNGDVQDASLEAKEGWYPFYDRSEIVKYLDRYTFDGEAVIYPGEGQSFFPRYFNGKYGLHQRCYTIKDYCANIHGKYLYYYLSTQNNYFVAFAVGSTVPSLRLDTFQQAKVFLPSLPEQQKISNFLSSVDEKISHSSAQIEKMEAWKKGLLQQMFC